MRIVETLRIAEALRMAALVVWRNFRKFHNVIEKEDLILAKL